MHYIKAAQLLHALMPRAQATPSSRTCAAGSPGISSSWTIQGFGSSRPAVPPTSQRARRRRRAPAITSNRAVEWVALFDDPILADALNRFAAAHEIVMEGPFRHPAASSKSGRRAWKKPDSGGWEIWVASSNALLEALRPLANQPAPPSEGCAAATLADPPMTG